MQPTGQANGRADRGIGGATDDADARTSHTADVLEQLVAPLEARGVQLWLEGSQLRFRAPPGAVTPELRSALAARRGEVLAALRARAQARVTEGPLSFSQRSLWLVHQQYPGSAAYNVAFVVQVLSDVDSAALREALQVLSDRHPMLRSLYATRDGQPLLRTFGAMSVELLLHDGAGLDDDALRARVHEDYLRPFDLVSGPVWRTSLFTRAPREHVLLINAHHIAVDGWSLLLLLEELRQLLGASNAGAAPPALPSPGPGYAEYTAWQADMLQSAAGETLAAHWDAQLRAPRAELDLPADHPRPPRKSGRGATHAFTVPTPLVRDLEALARAEGTTLFVLMLAAFKVLLMRLSGVEDVVVGTPTLGRDKGRFDRCIGHFVNPVPLRTSVSGRMPFHELLRAVRTTLLSALEGQEYPLARMVERLAPERIPGRSPLFETMFVLQRFEQFGSISALLNAGSTSAPVDFGGWSVRPFAMPQQEGQFDLSLGLVDIDDRLEGGIKYADDLFDRGTIARWAAAYVTLLRSVVATPGAAVGRLSLLDEAERAALLRPAALADAPPSGGAPLEARTMHQRFEWQAARRPEATAVRYAGASLSYGELNERANRLAHALIEHGAGPGVRVGLCIDRTADLVVGLLGILKAGAAYLPLDLAYPAERVQFILDDAKAPLLVSHSSLAKTRPAFAGTVIEVDDPALLSRSSANPPPRAGDDDLIYVIYTSGSTGRPKGTLLTHRAVRRLMDATHPWYGFDHTDRWSLFHSVAFDFSVWELWGALAYGGTVVVVPYLVSRSPDEFVALVRDEGVTVLNQTPSAFRQFVQADIAAGPPAPHALRHVVFGGEALELQSLRPWFERYGDTRPRLVNMYGITETCVHVTYRPIGMADVAAARGSLIGEPIPDLRLLVLEPGGEPTPVGAIGEIHVGGPGLALGYLDRPELTAERFVPDPWLPGERLYRSGDLARRTADGELEYIGRRDLQVKIRGFRIEIGEIEAALGRQPQVRQAAVAVHDAGGGARQLVAYVVAPDLAEKELREALRAALPDYMVPATFVFLPTLPLTGNGKVDLRALPPPEAKRTSPQPAREAGTPMQSQLLGLWQRVLKRDDFGIADNFFDLGGHSLLVVELLSLVREATGQQLPFAAVFEAPTVEEMAEKLDQPEAADPQAVYDLLARLERVGVKLRVEGQRLLADAPKGALDEALRAEIAGLKPHLIATLSARQADDRGTPGSAHGVGPVQRVPRGPLLPISHMQRRLWFLKQLDPSNAAYNVPCTIRFRAGLDRALLLRCLDELTRRHESLRSRFVVVEGSPHVAIDPVVTLPVREVDVSHLPDSAARDAALDDALRAFAGEPFDAGRAPLMRVLWVRMGADDWVLCLVFDHIVADGLSLGVLLAELQRLYALRRGGTGASEATLPPLPMQYVDWVAWQEQEFSRGALAEHQDFWKRQLAGLPEILPLPTDRPRPRIQTYRGGARLVRPIAPELAPAVRRMAREHQSTTFMVLLSAFMAVLQRHTGTDDIPVGTAVGNRTHPDAAGIVGFFANNIVLRGDLSGKPTVREHLSRVREMCLDSLAHQAMPFDLLVESLVTRRETDRSPLFQVMFVLQNWGKSELPLPGAPGQVMAPDSGTSRYDLTVDIFEAEDRFTSIFEFNTDLFDPATIERLAQQYERMLGDMVRRPEARLADLQLLAPVDEELLLRTWNATAAPYPDRATVHGLFEAQVRRTPQAEALVFEDERLTYAELNRRANRMAHALRAMGARPGVLVGLWLERSTAMVAAVLAVLKSGAAYVPLDPAFPQDRIDYMMGDAELAAVVTQDRLVAGSGLSVPTLRVDGDAALLAAQDDHDPEPMASADDLAYVIYTSGSTGRPKGVMLEHRSVVNFLVSMQREPGIGAQDRFVSVTTLSFDIAGLELHGPLTCGGTVVLASRATALDGPALARLLVAQDATLLQATPATWRLLLESGWQGHAGRQGGLKMLCGGEALPKDLAERLLALPGELWNLYGPTETTIWSTAHRVVDPVSAAGAVPIGRPIANTQVYVLDDEGRPAPVGVGGELCIAGDGLARGYFKRPELTAEKFVTLQLPGVGETRVYRTGDVARWRADGRLEFAGRRDHQVKLRGFRIELGEIEAVLATHPGVRQAVAIVREDTPGDQRLVVYVVAAAEFAPEAARATLRAKLPEYMVPNFFEVLPALPLTPNGKIDRKALPAPALSTEPEVDTSVVMNATEQRVATAWRELLGVARIGLRDNFFDLGGHSLLLVKLQMRLQRDFGQELPLVELFQRTTVQAQAERLQRAITPTPTAAGGAGDRTALQRARARADKVRRDSHA